MSRFLVVDNSATIRKTLVNHLRLYAKTAEVAEAESGKGALTEAAAHQFHAIFIGMGLANNERGLPVVVQLLAADPTRPVILCTSMPREHPDVAEALSEGAFAYLPKPVRADMVAKVLRDIEMDRGRLNRIH